MTHRSPAPKQHSWSFARSRFRTRRAAADELFTLMDDVVAGREKEQPPDHVAPEILATARETQEILAHGRMHLDASRQQRIWEDIMSATSLTPSFLPSAHAGRGWPIPQRKPAKLVPLGHLATPFARPFVNVAFAVILVVAIIGGAKAWMSGGGAGEPPQPYQLAAPPNPENLNATPSGSQVPASCPVTIPNGSVPPFGNLGHFPGPVFHGEHGIWTSFGPDGTVAWQPGMGPGGGIYGVKFLWYFAEGVSGPFRVTGTRLDAPTPPLRAETADQAAPGFSPSGLRFPSLGCWRITATAGSYAMTFTIWLYEGMPKSLAADWLSPTPPAYCRVTRQPSSGVNPDAAKQAPATTIAVGTEALTAYLPPDGTFEVTASEASRDSLSTPFHGVVLNWWQDPSSDFEPLISGEETASYGGSGTIDYNLAAPAPDGMRKTPIAFASPGCWRMEIVTGQTSVTFTIWLWTKELPPAATPVATPVV